MVDILIENGVALGWTTCNKQEWVNSSFLFYTVVAIFCSLHTLLFTNILFIIILFIKNVFLGYSKILCPL